MVNTLNSEGKVGLQLEHVYKPRGGCKRIFDLKNAEVLISGPAGTGKSRACLEKLHMMCLLTPNTRALILRKTLTSLAATALVTWRNYVIKEASATGTVVYYGGSAQHAAQYRYKNGSTVTIGGLDKPSRIMSSEYDIIYIQEATECTLEDIELVNTRLRNWQISFQQLIMDCNPAGDKHWLKLRCNDKRTLLVESRHEDNPVLFDEIENEDGTLSYVVTDKGKSYIEKLENLTGVRLKRLRYGLWVSAEGVIYEEFDPAVHILKWDYDEEGNKLPLPPEWTRYWVIDFGYIHPFVCKWYAEDEDGTLYMYREVYFTGRIVEDHVDTILKQVTKKEEFKWYDHFNKVERSRIDTIWTEPKPAAIICDHDVQARRTFERKSQLGTRAAIKFVLDGIDLVKARWKLNDNGEARMYYMEDALVERDQSLVDNLQPTCSVDEITSYVWAVGVDGRKKQEPVKRDDDGMDCDRYMVMFRDFKGKARLSLISS